MRERWQNLKLSMGDVGCEPCEWQRQQSEQKVKHPRKPVRVTAHCSATPLTAARALQATASRASYGQASSTAAPTITQAIWITGVSVTQTMLIPTPLVCAVSRIWRQVQIQTNSGCPGSDNGNCYPRLVWTSTPSTSNYYRGDLNSGSFKLNTGVNTRAYSVRCVPDLNIRTDNLQPVPRMVRHGSERHQLL